MQVAYGSVYRTLYETHWWWRARERWLLSVLRRYRPPEGWRAILDVGCGDGLFFDRLLDLAEVVEGVESDARLVDRAGPHGHRITVAAFDSTFQPGRCYSLVLMLDVLEHLHDPLAAVRHAVTLLEPDGLIVITVPAFMTLWTTHDVLNHHVTRFTRRRLLALTRDAALDAEEARYFFHWMYPAKLAVRALERTMRPQPKPPRVPPHWLNRALYALSRLEQRLLGALPIPFGSSLLLVARKGAG